MRQPTVDDYVRLTQDIPELGLIRNEVGVVRSTWFAPSVAYEVEFHPKGQSHQTRALLLAEQVVVEDGSLFSSDRFRDIQAPKHIMEQHDESARPSAH
jgi:hypothetical protein